MGAGLGQDVALLTDGRFSGGSHGFLIGIPSQYPSETRSYYSRSTSGWTDCISARWRHDNNICRKESYWSPCVRWRDGETAESMERATVKIQLWNALQVCQVRPLVLNNADRQECVDRFRGMRYRCMSAIESSRLFMATAFCDFSAGGLRRLHFREINHDAEIWDHFKLITFGSDHIDITPHKWVAQAHWKLHCQYVCKNVVVGTLPE